MDGFNMSNLVTSWFIQALLTHSAVLMLQDAPVKQRFIKQKWHFIRYPQLVTFLAAKLTSRRVETSC